MSRSVGPDVGRGPGGTGSKPGLARELLVLVEDRHELAEVRVLPVPARALALLQDLVDGPLAEATSVTATSSGQPKYGAVACARGGPTNSGCSPNFSPGGRCPPRSTGTGARPWRSPAARDDVAARHAAARPCASGHPLGVLDVHALGALEEHEVAQRLLAERQQRQVHPGRVVAGGLREVRPGQVRRRADADSRFCTSARCSISCAAMWKMRFASGWTASSSAAVRPSSADCFRLNAAYRYWHMIPCSSSAASQSM